MATQDKIAGFTAEIKELRTVSKALKDMILKIMESNKVVQLNVSKGAVVHKTREVKETLSNDYLEKHCKEFFGGDAEKAKQLVAFLNEQRTTVKKHDLKLVAHPSDSMSLGSAGGK